MNAARVGAAAAALVLCACSSQAKPHAGTTPSPSASPSAPASATALPVIHDGTVWLCRPDRSADPCRSDLTTTVVSADGSRHREPPPPTRDTGLDCFYVYPTVSEEKTPNADLTIGIRERGVALAQAARFSSVCRVWAPMYRQRTTGDLLNLTDDLPQSAANRLALASLLAGWHDYLAHHNNGRRVVLIGHSQGASMLIRLIRADVDSAPAVRAKVALAILLGGNVTVADGSLVGGSFEHLPLCTHRGQPGCVIAYSSFPSEPPAFAFFGRPGAGVSLLSGDTATNRQVACVNPAALGGGVAPLHPYYPAALANVHVPTPWVSEPGHYAAQCRHDGNATWLQVTPIGGAGDKRPLVHEDLGRNWGYHIVDVNLALGDLVGDVAALPHS